MKNRTTHQDWLDVQRTNPVALGMRGVKLSCDAVVTGHRPAAYFSGPPGIGKSYSVTQATRGRALTCNPTNYLSVLKSIGQAQEYGQPLFFDEADVIFRTERMFNVLKTATGPKFARFWHGISVDVPHGIYVSTNRNLLDRSWMDKTLVDHCDALFSRAQPLTIPGGDLDLWEYSVFLAQTNAILLTDDRGMGINLDTVNRALDWFTRNVFRLQSVSPRTLGQIASDMNQTRLGRMNPEFLDMALANLLTRQSDETPPPSPTKIPPTARRSQAVPVKSAQEPKAEPNPKPEPETRAKPKAKRERLIGLKPSDPDFMKRWLQAHPG